MSIRTVEYTVKANGIEPATKQFGGVQGDHKATELIFNIHPMLYESLTGQLSDGGKLIYRFDGYDGEGGFCRSDTGELTGTQVTYALEEWLTRFGGIVKVILVISVLKDDLTEMELYSFPALLQLKNLPEGTETNGEAHESMSVLAQIAKDSASTAVSSAEVAVEAQEKTELARAALEGGTVWVFDGGNAMGNLDLDGDGESDYNMADIEFVIDGEMSDSSQNAVMNKIVKAYVDNLILTTVESLTKQAKLDAHPVGSYYWSSQPESPADLFGGTWEQVQGKFILAADDNYEVGTVGGRKEITLTVENLPKDMGTMSALSWVSEDATGFVNKTQTFLDRTAPEGDQMGTADYKFSGNGEAINIMPPYEVAYCWKRTA